MEEEGLEQLDNACADLLSVAKYEAFPRTLFERGQGDWVNVDELCRTLGLAVTGLNSDVYASWLSDPTGDERYAVVIFYDHGSDWTTAGHYNRRRLLNAGTEVKPSWNLIVNA